MCFKSEHVAFLHFIISFKVDVRKIHHKGTRLSINKMCKINFVHSMVRAQHIPHFDCGIRLLLVFGPI